VIDFSIIIPAKNEAENITACLQSVAEIEYDHSKIEILVIDNGSVDATCQIAEEYGARVIVDSSLNISGLRNLGARHSAGRCLAFIDADCTVSKNWLVEASRYLAINNVAIFGSAPSVPENSGWVPETWFSVRKKKQPVMEVDWLESMNMFIPGNVFTAAGGFDETLVTCEDYELCQRFQSFGKIISDQRIAAVHHGEAADVRHFFRKERWRATSNYAGLTSRYIALKEWPSILLPLAQITCCLIAFILFLSGLFNVASWAWFWGFIVFWQGPLLILAVKKSAAESSVLRRIRLYYLFNIYFLARGSAVFGVKRR